MITSLSNSRIKDIRKLRTRKEREQTGLSFIEGIRIVADALQQPETVEMLIIAPELLSSQFAQNLVQDQRERGIPCLEVTAEIFQSISQKEGPQGIGAVIHQHWLSLSRVQLAEVSFWVALDSVQDPGNLGSILRTCDAVGCTGAILIGNCTDPYDPMALRGSMGAVFSLQLVKTSFQEFVAWKQQHNYSVIGTSDSAPTDYTATSYKLPTILLMGSERLGLAQEQQAICDVMVSIPMVGQSDSLNLSVATGIVLYEIFNQHRAPHK